MNEKNVKKEITLDDLARIIQNDLMEIKTDQKKMLSSVTSIEAGQVRLETDVAEIKETMGNSEANLHKKVDKIEYNTLEYRVEKLEKKFA